MGEQTYTLSSSPIEAMFQPKVTLLVGLEDEPDGTLKVYLGARWKGIHLRVPPEEQEPFRIAWASGQHVWMWPIPPAEALHRDEQAVPS